MGNVIQTSDRNGRLINFSYDNLNRNTNEVWLDEAGNAIRTFDFQFDAASQLLSASDPDSSYSYGYDLDGRVTSVSNAGTPNVPEVVLNYSYDPVDNLTEVRDSIDGVDAGVESFTYDELDRVTQITQSGFGVTDKRVDMSYDAASQMKDVTRYSDLAGTELIAESTYTFDNDSRLTDLVHQQNSKTLAEFGLVYDKGDRITQFTTPDGVSDFSYDDSDQLVDAVYENQADENYSYDDNGNRTNPGYVTGENNQLLSDGVYNYEYDNEGNRVKQTEIATGEVTEYQWDHRNRLVDVVTTDSDGNVIANSDYTYDVFDNRISKSVDADGDGASEAVVERYVLDEDHIALTFDGEGNLTERFLHGLNIDQVLAQENQDGEVLWALTDHLGSTRLVLDQDGNVVNNITYDAFGNITIETNDSVNFRFLFTGRESDQQTGLNHNRGRYYDLLTGRFISIDPIGFAAGDSNLYRYVGNNPLFYLDPSGFCGVPSSGDPGNDNDGLPPGFDPQLDSPENDTPDVVEGDLDPTPFPGDNTTEVAGDLTRDNPFWWLGPLIGVGKVIDKTIDSIQDAHRELKRQAEEKKRQEEEQQQPQEITTQDNTNEFDPTIIDIFEGDLDISNDIERFPNADDFLDTDTYEFPDGDDINIRDYTETFPRGIDQWLERPFFEANEREKAEREARIDEYLRERGDTVENNPLEGQPDAGRQGDRFVNGKKTEYKTITRENPNSNTVNNAINGALRGDQQARNVVVDARGSGLTQAQAEKGLEKVMRFRRDKLDSARVIGDGFDITAQ